MVGELITLLFNSLSTAMGLFIFSAGLTLVFGVLRILNFAHGGFFMIGAYLAYTLRFNTDSLPLFLAVAIVAAIGVGIMGIVIERLVFRPMRRIDESYSLIATYSLLLLVTGAVKLIWGVNFYSSPPPTELAGIIIAGDVFMPYYSIFIIVAGVLLYLLLDWLIHRTDAGKLTQSVANDPWMANLLGVNVPLFYVAIVVVGFVLAGFAGGLLLPNQSLTPTLADTFIISAFGVLIVGGMGSVRGAFLASILLCIVDSLGTWFFPELPGIFFFVGMTVMLLIRPQGIIAGARI